MAALRRNPVAGLMGAVRFGISPSSGRRWQGALRKASPANVPSCPTPDDHRPEVGVLLRRVRVRVAVSCGRSVARSRSRIFSAAVRRTGLGE